MTSAFVTPPDWLFSLARRTDLLFTSFEGEIRDAGDYLTIRTPANPTYHWGNFLIFARPPVAGDAERWPELFRQTFADQPAVTHRLFNWQGEADATALEPFLAQGYVLDQALVLSARQLIPPAHLRPDLEIRPLADEAEWEAAIQLQLRCRDDRFGLAAYEPFKRRQFETYRRMADAGRGAWFGAFAQGRLVGDLGLFHDNQLGRYQNVGTDPDFRRQGICANLVWCAGRYALETWGLDQLVMEADAGYHAARIYQNLGFAPVETNQSLSWWPGI